MTCTVDVPSPNALSFFFLNISHNLRTHVSPHPRHGAATHTLPIVSPVALTSPAQCSLAFGLSFSSTLLNERYTSEQLTAVVSDRQMAPEPAGILSAAPLSRTAL
jgi:hypothetical protein